ncbi:DNA-binding anti-repressor SinI [Priestia flexa]|nr:DNA-binding anti-repressor SinI [Priestia flexa]
MKNQITVKAKEDVQEWISLMQHAKDLGLTIEEIQHFLLQNETT